MDSILGERAIFVECLMPPETPSETVQGNTAKACIERQNSFRVESANSGMVVNGKSDVIAVFPDGRTVIYDAKTGYQCRRTSYRCSSTCIFCPNQI